jgi:hypothetical protein
MREFGIPFTTGLHKGLRAFPTPRPGEEELVECYNLVPTEHGLRGHSTISPLDFAIPFIEYFSVKDQADVVWYWSSGPNLEDIHDTVVPVVSTYAYVGVNATPATIPYWIQVDAADALATQLYIFPAENSGDLLIDTIPPAIGTGYDAIAGLVLRSLGGWRHRLSALSLDQVAFWSRVGR